MSKPRRPRHARPVNKSRPAESSAVESGAIETNPTPDGAEAPSAGQDPVIEGNQHPAMSAEHDVEAAPSVAAFAQSAETDVAVPLEAAADEEPALETGPAATVVVAAAPNARPLASAQIKAESFGITVMNYVVGEGEAFAAHMRALAGARSMAELVRLQIGEFQRAADATLTCWGMLTVSASRTAAFR